MSTSPEKPVPGVVTFTERGNAALDKLAATLAAGCDGSPTSIADLLEHVLETDIEDLAEALNETTRATPASHFGYDVAEVGPAAESPDEAARRRLGAHAPGAGGAPETRSSGIAR
jgi:hypothetical protein